MSGECSRSCPLVAVCEDKIAYDQTQADTWELASAKAEAHPGYTIGIMDEAELLVDDIVDLAERRVQKRLGLPRHRRIAALFQKRQIQYQADADSTRVALDNIREQCSGRSKVQATVLRLFGKTACGTTYNEIPTTGSVKTSKDVALELYDEGRL